MTKLSIVSAIDEMIISNTHPNSKELKRFIITKRNSSPRSSLPCSQLSSSSTGTTHSIKFNHPTKGDICTSAVSKKIGAMAKSGALGSITKCQSKTKNNLSKAQSNRRSAYALKNTSAKLLPAERVSMCLNNRVTADRGVDVQLNKETGKAHYGNLMRCSSVWVCPCCSGRILAHRGNEVEKGVETWTEAGGSVFMLTLTHSHNRTDNLSLKMLKLRKALSRFFGDRSIKEVYKQFGKVGQIKALETTYSEANGWHPHHHILMFSKLAPEAFLNDTVAVTFDKNGYVQYVSNEREQRLIKKGRIDDIQHVTFEFFIKSYWIKICKAVGLGLPNIKRGATFQNASDVKTYLTKFKTAQELTNAKAKKGKNGSRNQWEILADAHSGDKRSGKLWQIYAKSFKGERQLFWSRGLKKLLLIDEIDDDDINEFGEVSEDEIVNVVEVPIIEWNFICRKKWQPHLLDIVEDDYKNETENLGIFLYSVRKLVEQERQEYLVREQERIKNLVPPPWWDSA